MAIPIVPILEAISNLANTAWEIYRKTNQSRLSKPEAQPASGEWVRRIERLENSDLEQARLIGELSRDLEQFARAMQSAVEENQRRQARIMRLLYVVLVLAVLAVAMSAVALVKGF